MSLLGALIGVGGSLLGGLVGDKKNKKAQAQQNAFNVSQNDPANIRAKFEAAGFNPLLGVQGWSPTQQTSFAPSGMGTAIAEAGGVAAQFLQNKAKEASEVTRLQQQNAKLSEMLRDKALRPTVGGIFSSKKSESTPLIGDPRLQSVAEGSAWATDKDGKAASDEAYRPGTSPAIFFGMPWRRSGLFSDGEWVEAAYGENPLVSWPVSMGSFVTDAGYNLRGLTNAIGSKAAGAGPITRSGGREFQMFDGDYLRKQAIVRDQTERNKARNSRRAGGLKSLGF